MKEDNEECEAINRRDERVARKLEERITAEDIPIPGGGNDDELKADETEDDSKSDKDFKRRVAEHAEDMRGGDMNEETETENVDKRLREPDDQEEDEDTGQGKKRRLAELTKLVDEDDGGVGGQRRAAIEVALKKSLEKMIRNEVPLVHALCNREVLKAMIDDLDEGCTRKLTRELKRKQVKSDKSGVDVAEVYSPPRMSKMASQLGYSEGFALDVTTNDEEGRP